MQSSPASSNFLAFRFKYSPQHCSQMRAAIAQSVWRWTTGWTIGVLGFDSRRGLGTFLLTTASRTALGPTQPPVQWVPGALSLGIKRPGREADHSPPSSAEVKEWVDLYLHPQYAFLAWCLVKAQGQLYLYITALKYPSLSVRPSFTPKQNNIKTLEFVEWI
jgi:hypothetical protein